MKKLTSAAINLLRALSTGGGNYSTHPSTRAALIERGWMTQDARGDNVITEAGRKALAEMRQSNPSGAYWIYARRRGSKGELMWFDGRKFTNNHPGKVFGTRARAKAAAYALMLKYRVLNDFNVYLGAPKRRGNPESRQEGLDRAAAKLQDFSGYPARTVRKVNVPHDSTGLVIGEIRHLSYVARREGIAGSKPVEYEHDFSKRSRPLLAVNTDGTQLYIVGGRYRFTEAGVEDR